MLSRIRLNRKVFFAAVAMFAAVLSLTIAPAARAVSGVPDAMPTATEAVLYSFGVGPSGSTCNTKIQDGAVPKGSLTYVASTGLLFGRTTTTTAQGDGTIFQINPNGTGYAVDHFFAGAKNDGNNPRHNAMTLVNAVLYGTTLTGGKNDNGTIFSINDDGSAYSSPPLYDFDKSSSNNHGDQPHSCFVAAGDVLYGMTSEGGKHGGSTGDGTIFSFDTSSDTYTRLYSFTGGKGSDSHGQLILDPNGTTLYGMTRSGGKHDVGVIFSYDTSKKKFKVLHDFSCPGNSMPDCIDNNDGATPDHGTLVQSGSTLYGLTTYGGKYGNGTLFSIETNGHKFSIMQQFGDPGTNDGVNPFGSLMLDGTTLYGTTQTGGNMDNGTVFQIDTDGANYGRIYDFQNGHDAKNPNDNVILLNNTLYGMTENGGLCGDGAIFTLDFVVSTDALMSSTLDKIRRAAAPHGLNLVAAAPVARYDSAVKEILRASAIDPDSRSIVVIGNGGGGLWQALKLHAAHNSGWWNRDNPLDDFTREIVERDIAAPIRAAGARCLTVYPFMNSGRTLSFIELGKVAGVAGPSILGVTVHPVYGPWIAFRAALLLDEDLDSEGDAVGFDPCPRCTARSCIPACPARAVSIDAGWDIPKCLTHRVEVEPDCTPRCHARAACVLGPEHRYPDDELAYHQMRALRSMRPYYEAHIKPTRQT